MPGDRIIDRHDDLWAEWCQQFPIVGHVHQTRQSMRYVGAPIRGNLQEMASYDDAPAGACPICMGGHPPSMLHNFPMVSVDDGTLSAIRETFRVPKNSFGGRQTGKTMAQIRFIDDTHFGDDHWLDAPPAHLSCSGPDCIICQHTTPKEPIPVSKFELLGDL